MSDPKEPNRYDALRETERQVEADRQAEQAKLDQEEREAKLSSDYGQLLTEKIKAGQMPQHDYMYYMTRFETSPSFRKQAEAEVKEWTANNAEKTDESKTIDEKPDLDLKNSQSERMRQLRGSTPDAPGQPENDPTRDNPHDRGGRGR